MSLIYYEKNVEIKSKTNFLEKTKNASLQKFSFVENL